MYDPDGVPVIAYFFPNGYGTKTNDNSCSNVIASLYGHDNFTSYLARAANEEKILYIDSEKYEQMEKELPRYGGTRFPPALATLSKDIIIPSSYICKMKAEINPKLGLVNVLNNDGNVLIDVAQMTDSHIQNATIHNALSEWNETDDPFSPEATQRLIGKLKNEMPALVEWLSEGNYPKSSLVPELLTYAKMPHPLQVYKNLNLDISIEDAEKATVFDIKLSYAGNAEHLKYTYLPAETGKTSVVTNIIDAHDGLRLTADSDVRFHFRRRSPILAFGYEKRRDRRQQ